MQRVVPFCRTGRWCRVVSVACARGLPAHALRRRAACAQYCSLAAVAAGGDSYLTPTLTRMLLIFYHCDHSQVYRPLDSEI